MTAPPPRETGVATVEEIRGHFPALERRQGGATVAYFDGPGGTQVPRPVVAAMSDYLFHHNANCHWAYPTSVETDAALSSAREVLADFLGGAPSEVVFGANMTTLTFHLARALGRGWAPGDEIVVTELDHHANVDPWRAVAGERGLVVKAVPFDVETGQLDMQALEAALSPAHAPARDRRRVECPRHDQRRAEGGGAGPRRRGARLRRRRPLRPPRPRRRERPRLRRPGLLGLQVLRAPRGGPLGPPGPPRGPRRPQARAGPGRGPRLAWRRAPRATRASSARRPRSSSWPRWRRVRTAGRVSPGSRAPSTSEARSCLARLWTGLGALPGVRRFGPAPGVPRTPTLSFVVDGRTAEEVARSLAGRGVFVSHGDFYATTVARRLGQAETGLVRAGLRVLHHRERDRPARRGRGGARSPGRHQMRRRTKHDGPPPSPARWPLPGPRAGPRRRRPRTRCTAGTGTRRPWWRRSTTRPGTSTRSRSRS